MKEIETIKLIARHKMFFFLLEFLLLLPVKLDKDRTHIYYIALLSDGSLF